MKRLLLLLVLSTSLAKAEDFAQTMKYINSLGVTAGFKAVVTGALGVAAAYQGWYHTKAFASAVSKFDGNLDYLPQFKRVGWHGVGGVGMFYTSYQLLWNYSRVYAKQALAMK